MSTTETSNKPKVGVLENVDGRQVLSIWNEEGQRMFSGLVSKAEVSTTDDGETTAKLYAIHYD